MIRIVTRLGFTRGGAMRRSAWASGGFPDKGIFGRLCAKWQTTDPGPLEGTDGAVSDV